VNNAGVFKFEPFEAVTVAEFNREFSTNVLGPILTFQGAIRDAARRSRADRWSLIKACLSCDQSVALIFVELLGEHLVRGIRDQFP
jgi:NAD(P)-dependent dehydrogenase (short-subunit alcohol dehydrogenase family)